eukprot:NODE_526_length_1497_cov_340.768377.p1 GENE.NODE_526_length_1497_cov_340.768377~~NODE_526_length_1497_cov_340.768377.p1  ORF type:complete len:469 (+),score=149.47 NODE_526_length_1497_cov_340.768377:3-1409(+)
MGMVALYRRMMDRLGVANEIRELGTHVCDGEEVGLPPAILGRYGCDPRKPNICAYGHLDVQPARREDGWRTDPFTLTYVPTTEEEDQEQGYGDFPSCGKLYGRGSTDDKGPVLSWLFAIEAFQKVGQDLPVNVLFLVECMEESSSVGLEGVVKKEFAEGGFFADVEAVCVADNYWLGTRKPCVQYGLRGNAKFALEVATESGNDLHSGSAGGSVFEPMAELTHVLASLATPGGEILVPGIKELVAPVTEEERRLYKNLDFPLDSHMRACGVSRLRHDLDEEATLMHLWRMPSLSLHGIEGAHAAPGSKTVIPGRVAGKFSIRLVPNMDPEQVFALVREHCERVHSSFASPNSMRLMSLGGAQAFSGNPNDKNYMAARRANICVYGIEPDVMRSGGTIPMTLTMQETGRSVVLFPVGRSDDGAHAQNEKLDLSNFINGVKLIAAYLVEYARPPEEVPASGGTPPAEIPA